MPTYVYACDACGKQFEQFQSFKDDPLSVCRCGVEGKVRRVIRAYEAKVSTPAPEAWWTPAAEYRTPKAQADYEAGEEYSFLNFVGLKGDGMASRVDLPALGTDFAIPVFFVEGAQDLLATPDVAQRYFDSLTAPRKHLVLLERAGHDPNQDVIDAQYLILKERILPLVE